MSNSGLEFDLSLTETQSFN